MHRSLSNLVNQSTEAEYSVTVRGREVARWTARRVAVLNGKSGKRETTKEHFGALCLGHFSPQIKWRKASPKVVKIAPTPPGLWAMTPGLFGRRKQPFDAFFVPNFVPSFVHSFLPSFFLSFLCSFVRPPHKIFLHGNPSFRKQCTAVLHKVFSRRRSLVLCNLVEDVYLSVQ